MNDLEPGMFVEVWRTKLVSEVCLIEKVNPLILRKATAYERFKLWFRTKKTKAGEISAAVEAIDAINKAKEGLHQ